MDGSLNINLIIPFKDNKGRLDLYENDIERFKLALGARTEELKSELNSLFCGNLELTIAARSDGSARKYYWRFTSAKRDRKYNRLTSKPVAEYIAGIDDRLRLRLREMESELIDINANLKLIKGISDAIHQSVTEKATLNASAI
jgi:hypothetical protein